MCSSDLKSDSCAQFDRADVYAGSNYGMFGAEYFPGEVIRITSLSVSAGSYVLLTITGPTSTTSVEAAVGEVTQLPILEGGVSDITFRVLDAMHVLLDKETQHVKLECLAAPDQDGDTVYDAGDNCPTVANAGQTDTDANKVGDLCKASEAIPATGSATGTSAAVAFGLVLLGGAAMFVARRRTALTAG